MVICQRWHFKCAPDLGKRCLQRPFGYDFASSPEELHELPQQQKVLSPVM